MPKHRVHFEDEKEWDCGAMGECLKALGDSLARKGEITLKVKEERILISPHNPSRFTLRFETMPKGEESLKIEVMWKRPAPARHFDADWSVESE